jgi:predicted nucleotide-binding protein
VYSLLVTNAARDSQATSFEIERSRFLEYTAPEISGQFAGLAKEAIEAIKSWPCLVMPEGRSDERASIRRLTDISLASRDNLVVIRTAKPEVLQTTNYVIWQSRTDLGIEQFEFARNHFALKTQKLLGVLRDEGLTLGNEILGSFQALPLPMPTREQLLDARNAFADLSHTQIDDWLLEAGVPSLTADRSIGSRRDRANAILQFLLDHPGAMTAERSLAAVKFAKFAAHSSVVMTQEVDTITRSDRTLVAKESVDAESNRVFVVHGRDETALGPVKGFLKSLGLVPIVLHEQPSMGKHLLTKFVDEAELVTFAVVLMTSDDEGNALGESPRPRARQNVILELGYFLSHLGQARVCALKDPGLETPSDFDGIVYISMGEDAKWKTELKRELAAAGLPVSETAW